MRRRSSSPLDDRDAQVVERRWLPVDIDPVRPTEFSATETEREAGAGDPAEVFALPARGGLPEPVTASSGNGYWLLYPVELPNDEEAILVEASCAASPGASGASASRSTRRSNASRIVALDRDPQGEGRRHARPAARHSALASGPPELVPVPREQLEALVPPAAAAQDAIKVAGDRMPAGWVGALLDAAEIAYREGERGRDDLVPPRVLPVPS